MGRPEGSRIHEHAIRAAVSGLDLEGWKILRVRNINVPLVAVKDGRVRVAGHAGREWLPAAVVRNCEQDGEDCRFSELLQDAGDGYLHVGAFYQFNFWAGTPAEVQAVMFDELLATAQAWRSDGWRVVVNARMRPSGYIGVLQPDAIAYRANELWAVEATSESPTKRLKPYGSYDGVVLARFKGGQVFAPERPPRVVVEYRRAGEVVAVLG